MREIHTLRARWRELETEPRTWLHGHAGGNPGYGQADVLTCHRARDRPVIFVDHFDDRVPRGSLAYVVDPPSSSRGCPIGRRKYRLSGPSR